MPYENLGYREDSGDRILIPIDEEGSSINYWINWRIEDENTEIMNRFLGNIFKLSQSTEPFVKK